MKTVHPTSFIYPEIREDHYGFGGGKVFGKIIRPDGDWRRVNVPYESQKKNGVESSSCYVHAQQSVIASLLEEEYGINDSNFSERFNFVFSSPTPSGGDPLKAAQSFRDHGLIPDTLLPFSEAITTWDQFNSFLGGDRNICVSQGKAWRRWWSPKYEIVVKRGADVKNAYSRMKEALKSSPLSFSLYGVQDGDTYVPKPKGADDTHLVKLNYIDSENRCYIRDTYPPFDKVLPANYLPDFAMVHTLEKNTDKQQENIILQLIKKLGELLGLLEKEQPTMNDKPVQPEAPQPPIEPIKEPSAREKIFREARRGLGIDISPSDNAPDDLACVESVCQVLKGAGINPPQTLYTATFKRWLDGSPLFAQTMEAKEGNIIISPTGQGNGVVPRGHTGIIGEKGWIMSNDSNTGMWLENYTLSGWVERFRKKGGYKIYFYEAVDKPLAGKQEVV